MEKRTNNLTIRVPDRLAHLLPLIDEAAQTRTRSRSNMVLHWLRDALRREGLLDHDGQPVSEPQPTS